MKSEKDLIKSWLDKAEKDLLTAKHELTFPKAVAESICFHCQQAVEKYLKGYLVYLNIPLTRTHVIGRLIRKCESKDENIAMLKKEADMLTAYAVTIRYPGDYFEPSLSEAKEAFKITIKVRNYVLRKIK